MHRYGESCSSRADGAVGCCVCLNYQPWLACWHQFPFGTVVSCWRRISPVPPLQNNLKNKMPGKTSGSPQFLISRINMPKELRCHHAELAGANLADPRFSWLRISLWEADADQIPSALSPEASSHTPGRPARMAKSSPARVAEIERTFGAGSGLGAFQFDRPASG